MQLDLELLPTREHSNAFWSTPATASRLVVLLLNSSHDHWHVSDRGVGRHRPQLFWNLWRHAQLTVCADGGANRLYDRSVAIAAQDLVRVDYIKGDLDCGPFCCKELALRDDVREFFAAEGTTVVQDLDQDTNDLDKCLQLVEQLQKAQSEQCAIVIFGALGGRFDQEMQNINALFRWHDKFQQMVLLSEDTTARLLKPGVRHIIRPNFAFETRTCGLIPVAGTCNETTTSGLKWNLRPGMETGFGGSISTSNHVDEASEHVEVVASHPLIWTTALRNAA